MAAVGPCSHFRVSENPFMSSPSKDLKETESALRNVIQALIDGQEGFKKIGEEKILNENYLVRFERVEAK